MSFTSELKLFFDAQNKLERVEVGLDLVLIFSQAPDPCKNEFGWGYASQAACLLLLRHITSPHKFSVVISGGSESVARELYETIQLGQCPFLSLSFQSTSLFEAVPSILPSSSDRIVILNRAILNSINVLVYQEGEESCSVGYLERLIKVLEESIANRNFRRLADLRSPFSSPSSEHVERLLGERIKDVNTKLLEVLEAKGSNASVSLIRERSKEIQKNLLIQKHQFIEVNVLNEEGDADIAFSYSITNAGYSSHTSRIHQFWFETPQNEVPFSVISNRGEELVADVFSQTENKRELEILFPRPLRPLEQIDYQVRFQVRREFPKDLTHFFYYLGVRTITRALGLTVNIPGKFQFHNLFISHETSDGFLSDELPMITLSNNGSFRTLSWQLKNPRPGSLFRTFWEYAPKKRVRRHMEISPSERVLRLLR